MSKDFQPRGPFQHLADLAREKREAQERKSDHYRTHNAQALVQIARGIERLIHQAQAIPGTYAVWCRLHDADNEALALAKQWEERNK